MPGKNGGPLGFGTSLLDDSDVQVLAPADGQVLTYSAALGKWINGAVQAASGFTRIAQQVLGSSQASVTFGGIPQTYSALQLMADFRGDTSAASINLNLQINGDTGANYDYSEIYGSGSAVNAAGAVAGTLVPVLSGPAATSPASVSGGGLVTFPNYAGTTFHKQIVSQGTQKQANATGSTMVVLFASWWRSTAAITQLVLSPNAGNLIAGSAFTLYGLA